VVNDLRVGYNRIRANQFALQTNADFTMRDLGLETGTYSRPMFERLTFTSWPVGVIRPRDFGFQKLLKPGAQPTGFEAPERNRWSRGGSMRGLATSEAVGAAINYVVDKQSEPMAVYTALSPR